jgi:hypothetical protein
MSLSIDPAERARRLGDVAAILIDLARRARLAAESGAVECAVDDLALADEASHGH